MRRISPLRAAVSVGTVLGLWHFMWVMLVGIGWAKPVLDFVLQLHFLKVDYTLAPYAEITAAELVFVTFSVGAALGAVFAIIWNWLTGEAEPTWATDTKRSRARA